MEEETLRLGSVSPNTGEWNHGWSGVLGMERRWSDVRKSGQPKGQQIHVLPQAALEGGEPLLLVGQAVQENLKRSQENAEGMGDLLRGPCFLFDSW